MEEEIKIYKLRENESFTFSKVALMINNTDNPTMFDNPIKIETVDNQTAIIYFEEDDKEKHISITAKPNQHMLLLAYEWILYIILYDYDKTDKDNPIKLNIIHDN